MLHSLEISARGILLAGLCLALAAPSFAVERFTGQPEARFDDVTFPSHAHKTVDGGHLIIRGLELDGWPTDLLVQRFSVFAEGAAITLNGNSVRLPVPPTAYFRGTVLDDPASLVLLMVRDDDTVDGFVQTRGALFTVRHETLRSGRVVTSGHSLAEQDLASRLDTSGCAVDELASPAELLETRADHGRQRGAASTASALQDDGPTSTAFGLQLAVETDFEFYENFNDATAAVTYVGDLVAGLSTIYRRDINTSFEVGHLSLWSTAADPFRQDSAVCSLVELANHWEAGDADATPSLVHFLSGRNIGSGAWSGALCAD